MVHEIGMVGRVLYDSILLAWCSAFCFAFHLLDWTVRWRLCLCWWMGFISGLAEAPIFFLSVQINQLGCES